jgi:hypothetical protein
MVDPETKTDITAAALHAATINRRRKALEKKRENAETNLGTDSTGNDAVLLTTKATTPTAAIAIKLTTRIPRTATSTSTSTSTTKPETTMAPPKGLPSFHSSMTNLGGGGSSSEHSRGGGSGSGGSSSRSNKVIAGLRQELTQLRIRYEELEQESSYNAAKVRELHETMTESINSNKPDAIHQALLDKSVQVAEVSMELDRVRSVQKKLELDHAKIQKLRNADRATIDDLHVVIRSLQGVSYASDSDTDDDENNNDDDNDEKDQKKRQQLESMTPEMALFKTLKNMKVHVEVLEDDRQMLSAKCNAQKATIAELTTSNERKDLEISRLKRWSQQETVERLEQECELKDMKIEMLEQLVKASVYGTRAAGAIPPPLATNSTLGSSSSSFDTYDAGTVSKASLVNLHPTVSVQKRDSTSQSPNNRNVGATTPTTQHVTKVNKSNFKLVAPWKEATHETSVSTVAVVTPTNQKEARTETSEESKARKSRRRSERRALVAATPNNPAEQRYSLSLSPKPRRLQVQRTSSGPSSPAGKSNNSSGNGKQAAIFINGKEASYAGAMQNGVPHGTGTLRFKNGDTYLGDLCNGEMHGKGTLYHREGMSRGQFAHNEFLNGKAGGGEGEVSILRKSSSAESI